MKVVCPSPIGWSKVPGIFLNPGVCPVMRFAFLIPAITQLSISKPVRYVSMSDAEQAAIVKANPF